MSISKRMIGPLGIALLCWSQQAIAFECPRMEKTDPGVLQGDVPVDVEIGGQALLTLSQ